MTPTKKPHPVKGGARVLTTSRGHGMLKARTVSGCEFNHPARKWQYRTSLVLITIPYVRPQGGLAVAVIRAHPGQNFPSLTSRGRQLTGGVEALFRDSHDEGRVGRRYGTRMKTMTTDPYSGLPSPEVPDQGGSREAACLMEEGCYEAQGSRFGGCMDRLRTSSCRYLHYHEGFGMTNLREGSTRGIIKDDVGPAPKYGPPAPKAKTIHASPCPYCQGVGGERWAEADGSERGERCKHCDGWATESALLPPLPEPEIDTSRGDYFSEDQMMAYGIRAANEMYGEAARSWIAKSESTIASGVTPGIREFLGRLVRLEWMDWAREQPVCKPSWLVPWDELSEPEREVDRRIGERIYVTFITPGEAI